VEYVELPRLLDPWHGTDSEACIRLRYSFWQIAAFLCARRLMQSASFDVAHHVTWASFSAPTLAHLLGIPFVLGPVGGGQTAPLSMRKYLGLKATLREGLRNLRVKFTGLNPLARLSIRRAHTVLTSNLETKDAVSAIGAKNVHVMLDAAIDPNWAPAESPSRTWKKQKAVLWMGRLEPHKALNLAIEAFAKIADATDSELWVLGDGPLRGECQQLCRDLGVEKRVKFHGWVPHTDVPALMMRAGVFLFTSLRDTCPQPVLEAMAWGLPAVSLNHQGLRLHPDSAVSKIDITDPNSVRDGLAASLAELLSDEDLRERMGRAAHQWIQDSQLWTRRIEYMNSVVYPSCKASRIDRPGEYTALETSQ
jgi:glycosyltransferase involved in cell wall biosynthesis